MTNIESLFDYSATQFELIDHLLSMGVGAHFAALVFFLVMSQFIAPRYRVATALSCIVMVSAGTIFYGQSGLWENAFFWNGEVYEPAEATFSNGFRYVNWMVTIPCLLTQLLIVLNIRGKQLTSDATYLIITAWGMIITGYYGQLFEVTDMTNSILGCRFHCFFRCHELARRNPYFSGCGRYTRVHISPVMHRIFWLMMFAWTLYPIAYLIPWIAPSASGVVWRQGLFTVADVSSKVIYGLMISYVALQRSAAEGFEPAMRVTDLIKNTVSRPAA